MAKTKRTKKSGKAPLHSRNITLLVAEQGERVQLAGGARKDRAVKSNPNAKPVFLGRTYTGVNRGKVYPYASKKRGGAPEALSLAERRTVAVLDGAE